jgi:hypothetical protein
MMTQPPKQPGVPANHGNLPKAPHTPVHPADPIAPTKFVAGAGISGPKTHPPGTTKGI